MSCFLKDSRPLRPKRDAWDELAALLWGMRHAPYPCLSGVTTVLRMWTCSKTGASCPLQLVCTWLLGRRAKEHKHFASTGI